MYVAVICIDQPDSVALRMEIRPAHLEFLKGLGDRLKLGGGLMDDTASSPRGSLIVLDVDTLAEAEAILAEDPYSKAGLFASTTLKPWNWLIGNPDLPQE